MVGELGALSRESAGEAYQSDRMCPPYGARTLPGCAPPDIAHLAGLCQHYRIGAT
jgi:hypothetical protein